jgi:hypothetical protein
MAEERSLERLLSAASTPDMSPAVIAAESQTTITCWSLTGEKRGVGIGGVIFFDMLFYSLSSAG